MKEPIFARTRYTYTSYSDFWRLVELSNFKTCYVDEIDLEKDEIYVSCPLNGEHKEIFPYRRSILKCPQRATVALWQLEKPYNPDSGPGTVSDKVKATVDRCLGYFDSVWISDKWIAGLDPRFTYVEMGSHPELASSAKDSIQYDFAHMSYMIGRREAIYAPLSRTLRMAPNAWGVERDRILRSTRAMLNVHQDNVQVIEPLRIALAAAYRMAYLTEDSPNLDPLEPGKTCHTAPYDHLISDVPLWFAQQDLALMGERLFQRLCVQSNFRKGVMDALERIQ